MNRNSARLLAQNPHVLKRLAKYMAQQCFRNTVLEDFHAGITPYSQAGDYSDVFVKTPAGEIPWSKLSRLSDEENEDTHDRCGQPDLWAPPNPLR
jgi:hypothetical protein